MKKTDRLLTIMVNLRNQLLNAVATGDVREWMSSYDVAHSQSVTQPNAWRLLEELVGSGFVARDDTCEDIRKTVKYTLTESGMRHLDRRRIARRHAMQRLLEYKTKKFKNGLMS